MNRVIKYIAMGLAIALLSGCFESEKVRVVRVSVKGAEMQKGNGFRYFDISIFTTGTGTEFTDTKISDIVSVGYQVWAVNEAESPASFQFYASPVNNTVDFAHADSIVKYATMVFAPPTIQAESKRWFDWPESMQYAVNQNGLRSLFRQRSATYYILLDSPLLYIDSLAVIVTAKIIKK